MMGDTSGVGSLHRVVARRLAAVAVAISVAIGTAVYWYEIEDLDDAVVAMAVREAEGLKHAAAGFFGPGTTTAHRGAQFEAILDSMVQRTAASTGQYVIAEVYDTHKADIARTEIGDVAAIEAAVDKKHEFPDEGVWYQRHRVGGHNYIQVVLPLDGSDGHRQGYFEGVFLVPDEVMKEIEDRVSVTVGIVVLVIGATTTLLYPVILGLGRRLLGVSHQLLEANLETLEVLGGAIAKRDSDTHAHNYRVAVYAVRLAEVARLGRDTIRGLIKGAFLHDVGKIAIPDAILLKPGRLTESEFAEMKTHVNHGVDIVRGSSWLVDAAEVVRCHHEKVDGSGYPDGVAGDAIPITARVFAIADVFDALTSRRPYKEALPLTKTMAILEEGRGSHFDSPLLTAFAAIAPDLHASFAGREDDSAVLELRRIIRKYFDTGVR